MSLLSSSTASAPALERGVDARVDAAREAGVSAQPDHDGIGEAGLDGLGAAVARAVVDDDHLERRVRRPRRARRGTAACRPCRSRRGRRPRPGRPRGLGDRGVSAIGAMIIDPYAPVRRMNSETQPTPDPPPASRRRTLARARRPPQLGAPDRGARRRDRAHCREHDRPDPLPRRRRLRPLHGPDGLPPDRRLAVGVRAQRHRDPLVRERRAARGGLRVADRAPPRASRRLPRSIALVDLRALSRTATLRWPPSLLTAAAMILAGVNLTIPTALQARLDFRLAVVLDLTARAVSFATYAAAAARRHVGRPRPAGSSPPRRGLAGRLPRRGRRRPRRREAALVPDRPDLPSRDLAAAPARRAAARGRHDPRPRQLPPRRARARGPARTRYDVGIYGLAYRFMEAAIPLGAFIIAAVFPLLVRDEADHERRALQVARAADLLLVVSVGVAVATVVLAPDLVRLLGGAAYAPSVVPLRILVLSLPFTFVGMLLSWTLIARGLQHRLIPIAAAGVDAQPRPQPRARADVLVQGLRRRHAGDRGCSARSSLVVLVRTLARRRAVPRLRGADRPRRGGRARGRGARAALAGEIVGTIVGGRGVRRARRWPSASSRGPRSTRSSRRG